MNFCPNCGAKLVGRFCATCGKDSESIANTDEVSAPASDDTEAQASLPDNPPTPTPAMKEKKPLPKWMQASMAWCKTAALASFQYCRNHRKRVSIIAAGSLSVLVLLIVLISNTVNIYRPGRVDNIDLGFTEEQVEKKLGTPDKKDTTTWEWYSGKYRRNIHKIAKLEKKLENLNTTDDANTEKKLIEAENLISEILHLEMELQTLEHHRITVKFDSTGLVKSVVLDKDYIEMREFEDAHFVKRANCTLDSLPVGIPLSHIEIGARIYCQGGDYRMDYISVKNADKISPIKGKYLAEFTNDWGNYSTMIKVDDKMEEGLSIRGTIEGGVSYKFVALEEGDTSALPPFALTFSGSGQLTKESLTKAMEEFEEYSQDHYSTDTEFAVPLTALVGGPVGFFSAHKVAQFNTETTSLYHAVKSISFDESVRSVDGAALSQFYNVKSLTVDEKNPAYHCVNNCVIETATKTVVLGCTKSKLPEDGSISKIGDCAFAETKIKKLTIPDGVTSIGERAFSGVRIKELSLPSSLTEVGYYAFSGCIETKVYVQDFAAWSNIRFMKKPNAEEEHEEYMEEGSNPLSGYFSKLYINGKQPSGDYVIPDGCTRIPNYTFTNCKKLKSILIPADVIEIGEIIFGENVSYGRKKIKALSVEAGNPVYHSDQNCIINTHNKTLIYGLANSVIPTDGSVEILGKYAFAYCTNLTDIRIPDNITCIEEGAFRACEKLKSIAFGANSQLTNIGDFAFYRCEKLSSVTIPDSVTGIGKSAFAQCYKLSSVTIGNGVTSLGDSAFSYCSALTSVTIPGTVNTIEGGCFSCCEKLTNLTIQNGVKYIEHSAFGNCKKLTAVTIPKSVRVIDGRILDSSCSSLTSVTFENTDGWRFYGYNNDVSIDVSNPTQNAVNFKEESWAGALLIRPESNEGA